MSELMVVGFRPKAAGEQALLGLLKEHVPFLQRLGLATDRRAVVMRSKSGDFVEIFEWRPGALEQAHQNAEVAAMWERFGAVCEFVPLAEMPEIGDLFAQFVLIEL
jgi:hypothetical protein